MSATRVLKAGASGSDAQTTYNFIDLRQRCDAYVERVRSEAAQWIVEAKEEAASIRQAAYDEGRRDGMRDGLADAAAQVQKKADAQTEHQIHETLETLLPALQAATAEVSAEREQWLARWERDAVELSLAVASRLTQRVLTLDGGVISDRVREALNLAAGQGTLTLRMHPEDVAAIGSLAQTLSSESQAVDVVADQTITRGGCVVSGRLGEVNAELETQLDQIARDLLPGETE